MVVHPRLHLVRWVSIHLASGAVVSGPFAGMRFHKRYLDLPKILGTYEIELHEVFERLKGRRFTRVVDVGAAEGYYAVGVALWNRDCSVVAYELNETYHESISYLARINGVLPRIRIEGACDQEALKSLADDIKGTFLIMDVEGFEKELLDPRRTPQLLGATISVEVHDCFVEGCTDAIIERFERSHDISIYSSRGRRAEEYPLKSFISRLKLMHGAIAESISDGRSAPNGWLLLQPKNS